MQEDHLRQLLPRHYKVIDLYLSGDYTHDQIAAAVGMTRITVTRILGMPSAQDVIARRRHTQMARVDEHQKLDRISTINTARALMEEAAEGAAATLVENLLSGDEKLRNKSANDILDRVGIARVQKNDNTNRSAVLVIDADMAKLIHQTLELDKDD